MQFDTPSFLLLVNNGLGDPGHPNRGSWGGRYELYTPRTQKWFLEPETRPIWSDTADEVLGHRIAPAAVPEHRLLRANRNRPTLARDRRLRHENRPGVPTDQL